MKFHLRHFRLVFTKHYNNLSFFYFFNYRIVRNKAAEKAKHVHHQSQQQSSSNNNNQSTQQSQQVQNNSNGGGVLPNNHTTINVSVIAHAPPLSTVHSQQQQQQQQTQLGSGNNGLTGTPERTTGYSINGILGIQHTDPNGNSIKRKRVDDNHGEYPSIHIYKRQAISKIALNAKKIADTQIHQKTVA